MKSIFSTLSNDQSFPFYVKREGVKVAAAKYSSSILIKGGANVADKHHQTPKFVETKVSDEEFKALEASPVFQRLVKRGFLSLKKPTEEKRDSSAPLVDKDIKARNARARVTTNIEKPE